MIIKFTYPDDSHCYRAIHTVHAVFRNENDILVARVNKPEGGFKVFDIKGFEIVDAGVFCD